MLAAIMASTAFLSLFISNTSAAALMVSLVLPILKGEEGDSASSVSIDEEVSVAMEADDVPLDQKKGEDNGQKIANERYGKSLLLAVAYSASLGGVGTLVGTGEKKKKKENLRPTHCFKKGQIWLWFKLCPFCTPIFQAFRLASGLLLQLSLYYFVCWAYSECCFCGIARRCMQCRFLLIVTVAIWMQWDQHLLRKL